MHSIVTYTEQTFLASNVSIHFKGKWLDLLFLAYTYLFNAKHKCKSLELIVTSCVKGTCIFMRPPPLSSPEERGEWSDFGNSWRYKDGISESLDFFK